MSPSILIAGIGNIFNRDDAFGVEVAAALAQLPLPDNAHVFDFGIRGFDLVLKLLEGFGLVIFADVLSRGGPPGTLYVVEPELSDTADPEFFDSAHGLDPVKVLDMARRLGAPLGKVLVVGCEPEALEDETGAIGLSNAVRSAVPEAIELIQSLIGKFNERSMAAAIRVERY